ncbi:hypothetical protein [Frankia sp. EI5c]|uniref:hypothetical protein n=1 Tax=Frankia sp. EI5c TaxID=683316 RepID=UPI000A57DE9F|nr:hypothetical protein [Frankia sp. EI5c]
MKNERTAAGFDRLRPRAAGIDGTRETAGGGGHGAPGGGPGARVPGRGPAGGSRGPGGAAAAGRPAAPGAGTGRRPAAGASGPGPAVGRDAHGKRALYSGVRPPGGRSTALMVECSRCERTSAVSLRRALWVLTPSMHLPLPLRHPSLLRCPACGRPSWVRLALRAQA